MGAIRMRALQEITTDDRMLSFHVQVGQRCGACARGRAGGQAATWMLLCLRISATAHHFSPCPRRTPSPGPRCRSTSVA